MATLDQQIAKAKRQLAQLTKRAPELLEQKLMTEEKLAFELDCLRSIHCTLTQLKGIANNS